MISRRDLLMAGAALAAVITLRGLVWPMRAVAGEAFEITRTDAEWRALLGEDRYRILREEGTEPPFSSPLDDEKRNGVFHCA